MEILDNMIKEVPFRVKAIYFLVPISWMGSFDENDYKGYKFNYSKYVPEDYALLSEKEYKDEMIFNA